MMNATELKSAARNATISLLTDVFTTNEAVQFADNSWAILQTIDGEEVWTEITVKTKAMKATKVSPAFDPYEVAEAWKAEKEAKALQKAAKAAEKAAKQKKEEE